jgi:hypothetical protein
MALVELEMKFEDANDEEQTIVHTLSAPAGWHLTGGTIYLENAESDLKRFSFRIEEPEEGQYEMVILENVVAE